MTHITVYVYENMITVSRTMLLKSRDEEPDGDPGMDSRTLCLLLGRIGKVDHNPRYKVTSLTDSRYQIIADF